MFFAQNPAATAEYSQIASNEYATGQLGTILFCVSTEDLGQSKGDLYVALGLSKYLRRLGWGIMLWPQSRWGHETPDGIDFAVVMIESFVPGLVNEDTRVIAWVRNWADKWCELPYLDAFSQIWCSSQQSATRVSERYSGPVEVVPLATDTEIFFPTGIERINDVVTTTNFWGVGRELITALSELSASESVTWFGKNAQHLRIPEAIDHRHTIDYFSLPGVYSHWQFVIDDVIEPAAIYGNHNSRLFDALACEAIVITNTTVGLAELGLDSVPVYDAASPLPGIITKLKEDEDETRALAARLSLIVRSHHTWEVRANQVSTLLTELRSQEFRAPQPTEMLRWATRTREELRDVDDAYNILRQQYKELSASHLQLSHERDTSVARLHEVTEELNLSTHARIARLVRSVLRRRR